MSTVARGLAMLLAGSTPRQVAGVADSEAERQGEEAAANEPPPPGDSMLA